MYILAVRVLGTHLLAKFIRKHERARSPLASWVAEVKEATWVGPASVKARYPHMSIIGGHYVFNIGGNKYRLDTRIHFDPGTVLVLRVGTHEQYDSWKFD